VNLLDWAGLERRQRAPFLALPFLRRRSFLLFADPPRAIQLVIIISTALSLENPLG
jgi:hypothetical protein